MSIFRRLGSQKFKHEFYITIHSLKGSLRNTYRTKIIWKRSKLKIGKKLSETQEFTISSTDPIINETLTMENTIYKKSSGFLVKEAKLQMVVESRGSWVQFGTLSLNLSDFIMKPAQEQEFSLKDCSEKDLKVIISIKTSYKESNVDETSKDEIMNQINNTKNELALLENKMDDVLQAKEISYNELLCLKQDFEEFKVKEKGESNVLKQENDKLRENIMRIRGEVEKARSRNAEIKKELDRAQRDVINRLSSKLIKDNQGVSIIDRVDSVISRCSL